MKTKFNKIALISPRSIHYWESLGLGYIASYSYKFGYTPEQYSFYSAEFDSDQEIISGAADANIIGFSVNSFQIEHALKLLTEIKKIIHLLKLFGVDMV